MSRQSVVEEAPGTLEQLPDDPSAPSDTESAKLESQCSCDLPQTGSRTIRFTACCNRNGVRGIYTLCPTEPTTCRRNNWCRMRNGFYLLKTAKTDEKVRYTYSEMTAIVRTVLFMYAFDHAPSCSMLELINSDEPYELDEDRLLRRLMDNRGPRELCLETIRALLDELFGENFTTVTALQVNGVYHEYKRVWRYAVCGVSFLVPSSADYVLLQRFVNAPLASYTDATLFVNTNLNDHQIMLQSNPKRLDRLRFHSLLAKRDKPTIAARPIASGFAAADRHSTATIHRYRG